MSLIATIIFSFIPMIGIRIDGEYRYFGFPAEWLGYYGDKQFSFNLFGLIFNFLVFYFIFFLFVKLGKLFFKNRNNQK